MELINASFIFSVFCKTEGAEAWLDRPGGSRGGKWETVNDADGELVEGVPQNGHQAEPAEVGLALDEGLPIESDLMGRVTLLVCERK